MYGNWLVRVVIVTALRLAGVAAFLKAAVSLLTPLIVRPFRAEDLWIFAWLGAGAALGFLATRLWRCPQCGRRFWIGPPVLARFFYYDECPQCRLALRR